MKINSFEERQNFLKQNIKNIGSYALATYNGYTKPIWITKYENWDTNEDWFLEAPCFGIEQCSIDSLCSDDDNRYIIKNNKLYEIDCPQVEPFLPEIIDDLILISEEKCLDWILDHQLKE